VAETAPVPARHRLTDHVADPVLRLPADPARLGPEALRDVVMVRVDLA
jgi:hypothetical protein